MKGEAPSVRFHCVGGKTGPRTQYPWGATPCIRAVSSACLRPLFWLLVLPTVIPSLRRSRWSHPDPNGSAGGRGGDISIPQCPGNVGLEWARRRVLVLGCRVPKRQDERGALVGAMAWWKHAGWRNRRGFVMFGVPARLPSTALGWKPDVPRDTHGPARPEIGADHWELRPLWITAPPPASSPHHFMERKPRAGRRSRMFPNKKGELLSRESLIKLTRGGSHWPLPFPSPYKGGAGSQVPQLSVLRRRVAAIPEALPVQVPLGGGQSRAVRKIKDLSWSKLACCLFFFSFIFVCFIFFKLYCVLKTKDMGEGNEVRLYFLNLVWGLFCVFIFFYLIFKKDFE